MHSEDKIMIFSRYPVPGQAKTRLIPALGRRGAARLHRRMTEHAVGVARDARGAGEGIDLGITVCHTGARRRDFSAWLGTDLHYELQTGGDLGARLRWAFKSAFRNGVKSAITVGSDVPGLTSEILRQAFESLRDHDIVLGRAADGGYYLIGMKSLHQELFVGIDWGTGHVYEQTSDVIKRLGLNVKDLPLLSDVDRPEDLAMIRNDHRFKDVFTEKSLVSVIIPTLNEAAMLGRILDNLRRADAVEVIVVDGGSQDDTRKIAAQAGAIVLKVSGGRAAQQNAAAAAAKGRLLLFLHGDTLPPNGYADMIRLALDRPATVAGAFRFKTDDSRLAMRLIEWTTNFRSAVLQWPYGDQGLFMEKRVFDEMSGFSSIPIMEDFELVSRLRRRGTLVTLSETAITSARRWRQLGVVRTTMINQIMIAGFLSGVSIQRLIRLYRLNRTVSNERSQPKEDSQS